MTTEQKPKILCFGFGFTASFLAPRLRERGFHIAATCRREDKQRDLAAEGIDAFLFDGSAPVEGGGKAFENVTHLLSSVPPSDNGDPVISRHGVDIAALSDLQWAGYLSTTGVYGDHGGQWVDEQTPLTPSGARGRRRMEAEQAWQAVYHSHGVPVHIFRLAGIYGPDRNPLQSLRRGKAKRIDKPGQVFSRIHVDDIASVLLASMDRPNPGAVYNVADDLAEAPEKVVQFAAGLLAMEPPPLIPFENADITPMAQSFYDDNKRVSNDRIKTELGVRLKYPDYKTGLTALYHGMNR